MRTRNRTWPFAFGLALALLNPASAAPDRRSNVEILHSEPVLGIAWSESSNLEHSAAAATGGTRLRFEAFARAFELTLQPSGAPVLSQVELGDKTARFYQGRLAGSADSWVRLSLADGALRGLIWDGTELFVLEPAEWLGRPLVDLPRETSGELVLFRLADVWVDPAAMSCPVGTSPAPISAATAFDRLRHELGAIESPLRRIDVGLVADFEAASAVSSARLLMLRFLNEVDGIFTPQVGVQLVGTRVEEYDDPNDPFASHSRAADLLANLRDYRGVADSLRDVGVVHLFSGQQIFDAAGIAYLDSICDLSQSVGLTIIGDHAWWSASLVMAHELGHNFGAPHDSEGACAGTSASGFLMSPTGIGSSDFSDCSLEQIARTVAGASCLDPQHPGADGHIWVANEDWVRLNSTGVMNVAVANLGSEPLRDLLLRIDAPAALFIQFAESETFVCTAGGQTSTLSECTMAEMPAGGYETVLLTGWGLERTVVDIDIELLASNESDMTNNSATLPVRIQPFIDLSPTVRGQVTLRQGNQADYTIRVHNATEFEANDVVIDFTLSTGLALQSVTGGTCSLRANGGQCRVNQVPPEGDEIVARIEGRSVGDQTINAEVSAAEPDGKTANNDAILRVEVFPPLTPDTDEGGGALSLIALLIGLLTIRRRRAAAV